MLLLNSKKKLQKSSNCLIVPASSKCFTHHILNVKHLLTPVHFTSEPKSQGTLMTNTEHCFNVFSPHVSHESRHLLGLDSHWDGSVKA